MELKKQEISTLYDIEEHLETWLDEAEKEDYQIDYKTDDDEAIGLIEYRKELLRIKEDYIYHLEKICDLYERIINTEICLDIWTLADEEAWVAERD